MQFKEEIIPYFELALGECSSPQQKYDVSDDYISDVSNADMDEYDVSEHN